MSSNQHNSPLILVTGATGQLGKSFFHLHQSFPMFRFCFADRMELDITHQSRVNNFLKQEKPAVVINCAGYTNVERAEADEDSALQTNGMACGFLAEACDAIDALLVHFSTDYVFDGKKNTPYREKDTTNPLSAYGRTKLWGEKKIEERYHRYLIIRTSWLYSVYGHNFYNTMQRLARENQPISVVSDQYASPTWAGRLAADMLAWLEGIIMRTEHTEYGIYHYSHGGEASWWDFASAIMKLNQVDIPIRAISTTDFPMKAERPAYSKLDASQFYQATGLPPVTWQDALNECIQTK